LKRESWIFLFAAIGAACALAAFCKIDVFTVTNLFGTGAHASAPFSFRDGIIIVSIFASFVLSGLGFYLSIGDNIPHLTRNQKHVLLDEVAKMRTLMSSILIAFTNGDRATEPLAHDLGEIFNRSGISPWYVYASPDNRSQSGIILCIKDLNHPPPATEDLKSALRSANIHFEVSGFPRSGFSGSSSPHDQADENLVLWVAPNPL
jgi:hypothetical protein